MKRKLEELRRSYRIHNTTMTRIRYLVLFVPFFAANSFFRFLGAEKTPGGNIVLFGILLLILTFLFRSYCLNKKCDFPLVFLYISLLFSIALFACFLRTHLLSHFVNVLSFVLLYSIDDFNVIKKMVSGSDEGIPPASAPSGQQLPRASSSTTEAPDSDASGSQKSGLNRREEELLEENLEKKKGKLGDGQRISDVKKDVEKDLNITSLGEQFELIQEIEKELSSKTQKEDVTKCTFISISENQTHVQDGQGRGNPNDCSNREGQEFQTGEHETKIQDERIEQSDKGEKWGDPQTAKTMSEGESDNFENDLTTKGIEGQKIHE